MIVFVFVFAALACLIAGFVTGTALLAYFALGIAVLSLFPLAWRAWRDSKTKMSDDAAANFDDADSDTDASSSHGTGQSETGPADKDQGEQHDTATRETAEAATATRNVSEQVSQSTLGLAPTSIVHVVPGRKRFHLKNCRLVTEHSTEELTLTEAREEGFTPCSVCIEAER